MTDREYSPELWSARKALVSTVKQAWSQAAAALPCHTEKANVSDALRELESAIFRAEIEDARKATE